MLLYLEAKSPLGELYTQRAQMYLDEEQARALIRDLAKSLGDLEEYS